MATTNPLDFLPLVTAFLLTVMFVFLLSQIKIMTKTIVESVLETRLQPSPQPPGYEDLVTELRAMVQERKEGEQIRETKSDIAIALSANDRIQLARLVALMNGLDGKVTEAAAHAEGVAVDLAAAHDRANEADGPTGAAADAASKTV